MQVSDCNNVKIYNLSAGKSLPEWLSERKRRALLKKDVDLRRRIQLIQDFDMPGYSISVQMTKDGQYIFATGKYKPRIKCFDVNNLSLKFDRCFDSDPVTFQFLSDDYKKFVVLHNDRYLEFHVAHGKYYRLRIPKYGRDMKYNWANCDLFIVGVTPEVYRLNLERGQFLSSYQCSASVINKCAINPIHHLYTFGSKEGTIEFLDPRDGKNLAELDIGLALISEGVDLGDKLPSVTALQYGGHWQLAVGTATGQVLLFDIRKRKPLLIKDHHNNGDDPSHQCPITNIEYHHQGDLIYSMDPIGLKIWNKNDGKLYTNILHNNYKFSDLCVVPETGMVFMANEGPKIQSYFMPSLGPAPRWASFLDSLTEELEETNFDTVYDDYKFVTRAELEDFGLVHLTNTKLLRAHMHGYYMDMRLYKKIKAVSQPFEYNTLLKQKTRETIEKDRKSRLKLDKLPKVNEDVAKKWLSTEDKNKRDLLSDTRFSKMFEDPDFEVDVNSETYRLLNPVNQKMLIKKRVVQETIEEELEGKNSSDESTDDDSGSDSSDSDNKTWVKDVKKAHKDIRRANQRKVITMREADSQGLHRQNKKSLGERLHAEGGEAQQSTSGNRQMTFPLVRKSNISAAKQNKKHHDERKKLVRTVHTIKPAHKFRNRR